MTVTINIHGENAAEALRELRGFSDGLLSSTSPVVGGDAGFKRGDFVEVDMSYTADGIKVDRVEKSTPEAYEAKRERGKPAPGKARRTKEEIAEDEAADAADQPTGDDSAATKQGIPSGEERVDPAEVEAQDKADEQAEVEQTRNADKPLTVDDVKAVVNQYVGKYGLPATQEDGPKIFVEALGTPPEGEAYWKMSLLADASQAQLAKTVEIWTKAVQLNPLKRAAV